MRTRLSASASLAGARAGCSGAGARRREMGVEGHGLQQISRAAAAEAISAARSDS